MNIRQGFEDTAYGLLFILTLVVIYVAQHQCVKYGYDAAVSAYGSVTEWVKDIRAEKG